MTESLAIVGYCTNVHAGTDLGAILTNLRTHALAVRQHLGLRRLPVGLWFSETAVQEALRADGWMRIQQGLQDMGLIPYTLNGFPQGDFHSPVVKHRVYVPTWWDASRLAYTRSLVLLLDRLLEPGREGSISTLPIAWGNLPPTPEQWHRAAAHLIDLAEELHQRYEEIGRRIVLAIEPEPGCAITDTSSLRRFFADHLSEQRLGSERAERIRRHLTMCHDVCHAAVMGEDQAVELRACRDEGIQIGKVQISSAIRVRWTDLNTEEKIAALQQLSQFAEDRYLHQTMVRTIDGRNRLHEDLPELLHGHHSPESLEQHEEWRIHFHVPIDIDSWGHLASTRNEIETFLEIAGIDPQAGRTEMHLEVETYAWGVLPEAMRPPHLHLGIARELEWLQFQIDSKHPSSQEEDQRD